MKMDTGSVNTIERVGIGADQEFTIDFSAKMASILADGLYSDKIQSVIRELSCNAYDSHVAAGNADTPIEVHFPNRFEPWFHVRDFGTGLSHDEVMTIYTRYGASTKTNSNDFIGALGLGSKSPFALTEAFTVTARKNGIENHYSMYRNEQGMPSVAHLHQNPTTETDGVTVTVPVRDDQRSEFITKSKNVYKWFAVKPNTIGDTIEYETVEYAYQGNGWGIRKAANARHYRGYGYSDLERPVAIMGLVAYPLDVNSIKNLSEGARELLNLPVVLNFAIGELEIAANREALGYDERTCATIVAKMNLMIAELGKTFEKEIAGAATLWKAKTTFGKIFDSSEYSYNFSRAYRNLGLKWRNQVIKNHYQTIVPGELYGVAANATFVESGIYLATHRYKRPRVQQYTTTESFEISCEDRTVIMFNDVKLGGMTRITEYHKANNHNKYIVVFNPSTKTSFDKIRKALGNPEVIMTSTLPKPERKKVQRTGVLQYTVGFSGKRAWKEVEIDLEQGGCYVDLDGWDMVWNGKDIGDVSWWLQKGLEINIIPSGTIVYAMRNKNKKLVASHADWTNLIDKIKEGIDDMLAKRDLGRDIAYAEEYSKLTNESGWQFWNQNLEVKDPTSPMLDFIAIARKYKAAGEGLSSIQAMINRFGITVEKSATGVNLVREYTRILNRYPMMHFVTERYSYSRTSSEAAARVVDYINHIDATAVFIALQDRETEETH